MEEPAVDFESKYISVKKKMHELTMLRVNSVLSDIHEIQALINEHRAVHATAVQDRVDRNNKLEMRLERRRTAFDANREFRSANDALREYLGRREPVLEPFIARGSMFRIQVISRLVFHVRCGDEFAMQLTREDGNVTCGFMTVPDGMERCRDTQFVANPVISFDVEQMSGMCECLEAGLRFCGLGSWADL